MKIANSRRVAQLYIKKANLSKAKRELMQYRRKGIPAGIMYNTTTMDYEVVEEEYWADYMMGVRHGEFDIIENIKMAGVYNHGTKLTIELKRYEFDYGKESVIESHSGKYPKLYDAMVAMEKIINTMEKKHTKGAAPTIKDFDWSAYYFGIKGTYTHYVDADRMHGIVEKASKKHQDTITVQFNGKSRAYPLRRDQIQRILDLMNAGKKGIANHYYYRTAGKVGSVIKEGLSAKHEKALEAANISFKGKKAPKYKDLSAKLKKELEGASKEDVEAWLEATYIMTE